MNVDSVVAQPDALFVLDTDALAGGSSMLVDDRDQFLSSGRRCRGDILGAKKRS